MKKFIMASASVILLLGTFSANAATRIELTGPDIGVRLTENQEFLTDTPNLMASTLVDGVERLYLCNNIDDESCKKGTSIKSVSFLPPCDSANTLNCIKSVYAVSESGTRIDGKFQRYVAEGSKNEYLANPAYNLPQGVGQGSIWNFPGLKNGAGNEDYYVGARFDSWARMLDGRPAEGFIPARMLTGISPIETKIGDFGPTQALDSKNPSSDGSPNGGVGSQNTSRDQSWKNCVVTETGKCYMAADFPTGYRFGITLSLGATLKGWFHGRIYRPVINTQSIGSGGAQDLTIEALPVIVPTIEEKIPTSLVPNELREFLRDNEVSNGFGYVMPESSGDKSFEHTKLWIPLVKDKATTSLTYWTVRTLDRINDPTVANCTKSGGALSGVVTTNSLVYNAGPPDFDKSTQSLNYKVLSTHYSANGELAKGTYDLILSSSVARCIYGFTNAPISASLTILSEDGSPQVATQVINEKNGWLTLSAAGFTYSSPTIAVKLSQEAPVVVATPTPTPTKATSTNAAPAKKITITCTKGISKKKITAANPKCPTGYKKKG